MHHMKILWLVSIWTCYASKDSEDKLNGENGKDLRNCSKLPTYNFDNAYKFTPTYNLQFAAKVTKQKVKKLMDPCNIFDDDDLSELLPELHHEMTSSTAETEENGESPSHYNSYLLNEAFQDEKYHSSPLKFVQEEEENEIEKEDIQEIYFEIKEDIILILGHEDLSPIVGSYLDEDDFANMMKVICAEPGWDVLWDVLLLLTRKKVPETLAVAKFYNFETSKKIFSRFKNKIWKEASTNEFKMLSQQDLRKWQIFFSWEGQMNEILGQFIVRTGFCFDNDCLSSSYHRALMLKSAEPCLITASRKFIRITNKRNLCTKVDEECETTELSHKCYVDNDVDDVLYHRKSSEELFENGEQIGDCVFTGITLSFFYNGKYFVLSDSMFYEHQETEGLSVQLTYRSKNKNPNEEFFIFKYESTKRIQKILAFPFLCESIAEIQKIRPFKNEVFTKLKFSQNASRFEKLNPENFNKIRNKLTLPTKY